MILTYTFQGAHFFERSATWEFPLPSLMDLDRKIRGDYRAVEASPETGWVQGDVEVHAFAGDPDPVAAARHIARIGFRVVVRDWRTKYRYSVVRA